jgi:lipid-A-disaccharide synthase
MPVVMLSAGEASGDLHAASFYLELRKRVPEVKAIGMGGSAMRDAGVELRYDSSGIGVIGLAEILRHYGEIRQALRIMRQALRQEKPDLLICVDYKEFNFRLATTAKACGVKVLFYVSPQVWAWRPGRVKSYGRIVDHMAVIFPFEVPFYRRYGIPVTYVGHPLAGKVRATEPKPAVLAKLGLSDSQPLVGLFPGSRVNELKRILPVIVEAAKRLGARFPALQFLLFKAPALDETALHRLVNDAGLNCKIIAGRDYNALHCCDAAIAVSGTVTLEAALAGVPMAIVYRLSPVSYWLGRLLVNIDFIGLPNILAGKPVAREFIQHEADPNAIADEIAKLLTDRDYAAAIRREFGELSRQLGAANASQELAKVAAAMLDLHQSSFGE